MNQSRPQLFGMLAGLFLAVGLVLSAMLATSAWLKIRNSHYVTVKGSAQSNVESDLAIWSGSFEVEAETLLDAQRKIQTNREFVANFLGGAGVTNFTFTPVKIDELTASQKSTDGFVSRRTTGYSLSQVVTVESANVELLDKLDSTPLLEKGVIFTVAPTQFIYTKSGEAKIEMLAEATKDARARAEQIASQGGRGIAQLDNAQMGIFQITPLHTTANSWDGESDRTAKQKTITAVVTATFLLK